MDSPDSATLQVRLKYARQKAEAEAELGPLVMTGIHTEWSTQMWLEEGMVEPKGRAEIAGGMSTNSYTSVRVPGGLWLRDLNQLDSAHEGLDLEGPLPVTGVTRRLVLDTDTGEVTHWNWMLSVENPDAADVGPGGWVVDRMLRGWSGHKHLELVAPGALAAWQRGAGRTEELLGTSLELLPGMLG